jgi:hypothetical protein
VTIDGVLALNHTQWDAVGRAQVTVVPDPSAIEIRFGQGPGGVGALNQTTAGNNALNGVIYEVTLGAGNACDKLTSTELLDLTGLRIIPSNLASEDPLGNDYVIAQAGGYIGISIVEGLPSKWKTVRKGGTQFVLTSKFGTVLMIR